MFRRFAFVLAVAAVGFSTVGCSLLSAPEIVGLRPRITGLDFQGVDLAFDIDVDNPYPFALRSPRFRYGLAVEGQSFLSETEASGVDLPAGGIGTTTVPVRLGYLDLLELASHLVGANQGGYRLEGAFLFDTAFRQIEVPFAKDGLFPILKMPNIRVTDLRPIRIQGLGAEIGVDAQMTNPNIFGIGLDGLGYALRAGQTDAADLSVSSANEIGPGQSGALSLTGTVSAWGVIRRLLSSGALGDIEIAPSGFLETPYGNVPLRSLTGGATPD